MGFLRAQFTHRCSREGDPQLHTHSILVNLLEAPDGRRAALDGGLLFQHAKAADGIYQAALRARGLNPDTASGRAAQTAALATRHRKVRVGDGRSLHDRFAREAVAAGFAPRSVLEAALPSLAQHHRQPRAQPIERSPRLLDAMTGPDGVTKWSGT